MSGVGATLAATHLRNRMRPASGTPSRPTIERGRSRFAAQRAPSFKMSFSPSLALLRQSIASVGQIQKG
jgi:hypothetical protein